MEDIIGPLEPVVKEAEKSVQPLASRSNKSTEELIAMGDTASEAVSAAKASMKEARAMLHPYDESLDEGIKKQLRAAISSIEGTRKKELKLEQIERRVARVSKLLETFKAELGKLKDAQGLKARQTSIRLLRLSCRAEGEEAARLSVEELFDQVDTDCNGSISEDEWVAFLEAAQDKIKEIEVDR